MSLTNNFNKYTEIVYVHTVSSAGIRGRQYLYICLYMCNVSNNSRLTWISILFRFHTPFTANLYCNAIYISIYLYNILSTSLHTNHYALLHVQSGVGATGIVSVPGSRSLVQLQCTGTIYLKMYYIKYSSCCTCILIEMHLRVYTLEFRIIYYHYLFIFYY